jgi:hypothetical protein
VSGVQAVKLAPLMSSAKSDWRTPDNVLDLVRQVGSIALDPATSMDNPTGARVFCVHPRDWIPGVPAAVPDGLNQVWPELASGGLPYVNPPYGRDIGRWLARCWYVGQLGGEVIALLPARTDTAWWNRFVAPPASQAVCFWAGRLTFVGAPSPAPFPSAVAYYGRRANRFADVFETMGAIWR